MIFELLDYIGTFLLVFVTIFLWHELMHIKSQGILMTGTIWVHKLGMTVSADTIHNERLHKLGGGILSSIVSFLAYFLSSDPQFQFSFFTLGWVNLCYGLYEGYSGVKYRYYIYAITILLCSIYWLLI